jgi:hypothetical protein
MTEPMHKKCLYKIMQKCFVCQSSHPAWLKKEVYTG